MILPRATVWLRLPYLPSALWTRSALELVVSGAGRLVRLDPATEPLTQGQFARVAVEIDLQRPLLPGSDVVLEGSDAPPFW